MTDGDPFVSPGWVHDHLNDPDLRLVDGTFYLPAEGVSAHAEYDRTHLPGAVFLDVDAVADPASDLPHMLPPAEQVARQLQELGIGDTTRVVVYDQQGVKTAGRAWWLLRVIGHDRVAIMDGGLPAWMAEKRPVESGPPVPPNPATLTPRFRPELLADLASVRAAVSRGTAQIADARPPGRFIGDAPEPRADVRRGHMPGARNIPVGDLVDPVTGRLKDGDRLRSLATEAGLHADEPVIASCGSGVTASTLAAAMMRAGCSRVSVYDGSWAEWGRPGDTPVAVGAAHNGDAE